MYCQTNNYLTTNKECCKDKINNLARQIFAQTKKGYALKLDAIREFLALLESQQKQYSELSYQGNGDFTLVLKAKKNKTTQIALKVIEYDNHSPDFEAMLQECSIQQSLTRSDYFISIKNQFYLTEENDNNEESSEQKLSPLRRFFVQEMDLCEGTLNNLIQQFRQSKKEISENLKETLAIQMLDSINLLHSRHVIHRDIKPQNFLVSQNNMFWVVLKLCGLRFASPASLSKAKSFISEKGICNYMAPETRYNKFCIESDLFSFALVLLQLDNIPTFDYSKVTNSEFGQLYEGRIFQKYQINRSSLLYKIACTFLSYSPIKRESAQEMLLILIKKSKEYQQIPVFSLITQCKVYPFSKIGQNTKNPYQINESYNLKTDLIISKIINQINKEEQNERQLTTELIKGALKIMVQWKEFGVEYDLLGTGANGIVFGVDNLMKKRKSALKLQLCLNKAETIREMGIMRICQTPYIVEFYGHTFFADAKGNQFVVFELERCKYSLKQYLEQQRKNGEYSERQKYSMMQQIMDSVNFLHQHKILHGDLKLDNFLITENQEGEIFVKLTDFDQAQALLSDSQENQYQSQLANRGRFQSSINCMINNNKRGTLLYYAPERWKYGSLSTYQADSFSIGLILLILDNYLVFSEDQLFKCFCSFTKPYSDLVVDKKRTINTTTKIYNIAKGLLRFQVNEREGIRDKIEQLRQSIPLYSKTQKFPVEANCLEQKKCLNFERIKDNQISQCLTYLNKVTYLSSISLNISKNQIRDLEAQFLLSPLTNFSNLASISLNLELCSIESLGAQYLLSPLSNLNNLTSISLNLEFNSVGDLGAQSLLSPLSNLSNLSIIQLYLQSNQIGDLGVQSLLSPLTNLCNITSITLNLQLNKIEAVGALSLLSPLSNFSNLASISLDLRHNKIGDLGAYALLSPFTNLCNLASIFLNLECNSIGPFGVSSLLSPLSNLSNLSSISLNLRQNEIGDIGAQFLLSPLTNLRNLAIISLNLSFNKIGDLGASSLLSPLTNIINLASISFDLSHNEIGDLGAQVLLSPLANLNNLGSISLDLECNQIKTVGVKSLLSPLINHKNLGKVSLNLWLNKIEDVGAQTFLKPLINLSNLDNISLQLGSNEIGEIGAQTLLSPFNNLINLTSITLNLQFNRIGAVGAQSLLSPLINISNLSSISLDLRRNKIGDLGAQSLLSPLRNLSNLTSILLDLRDNEIGDLGASSLLSPLSNLSNLANIELNLQFNEIRAAGAQSLLYPLRNLRNLASISLYLWSNQIGDLGAQYLLSPLKNISNLSSISINLQVNKIGAVGLQAFLSLLTNLSNLSSISLDLRHNEIGDLGAFQSLLSRLANLNNQASITLDLENKYQTLFGLHYQNIKIQYH